VTDTVSAAAPLVLEALEGGVLTLMMNRPERLNALNVELGIDLDRALGKAAADPGVRVVVLTGAGRAFCSGGDLGLIREARESGEVKRLEPLLRAGSQLIVRMRTMAKPLIAAVNGAAAGAGMNVALACDLRIAAEQATFGQNFARVGLFPDYGGTFLLPRLIGAARAAELLYLGHMINAHEAERIGVVNHVVPNDQILPEARALATRLAEAPPLAVRALKQVLFATDRYELERALEVEIQQQMKCFASADAGEGIRAFFEKRAPKFEGK
jgi:2-(1,2-epoxy-1,2-dihydrophenyl)acetyl-CoA isomerase